MATRPVWKSFSAFHVALPRDERLELVLPVEIDELLRQFIRSIQQGSVNADSVPSSLYQGQSNGMLSVTPSRLQYPCHGTNPARSIDPSALKTVSSFA